MNMPFETLTREVLQQQLAQQQAQLEGLSSLLLLQQRARQCDSLQALQFLLVNDSRQLSPCQQCLLWLKKPGQRLAAGQVVAASDTPALERTSPLINWADGLGLQLARQTESRTPQSQSATDPKAWQPAQWQQLAPPHALWLPLYGSHQELLGGLILLNDQPWAEAATRIFSHWAEAASHALAALHHRPRRWRPDARRHRRNILTGLALTVLLGVQFIPVSLSVLTPAEVVPSQPLTVRAGLDSTVARVHVEPNQPVSTGQLLITLDDSALRTRLEVAQQSLEIARGEQRQASQSMLHDPRARASLPLLNLRVEKQQAEVDYLQAQLGRTAIHARQPGIALFEDPNQLTGRPVRTGDPLLTVADPQQTELTLWLPVGDDIQLPDQAPVRLFPASSPERYISARLTRQGYQAHERPEVGLAWRLQAQFDDPAQSPRIGQRGTARIEGEPVPLWFYLLRRPAAWLRQQLGL